MEASQEPEPRPSNRDPVSLDTNIIAERLRSHKPVNEETARLIWLMNQIIDNPETTDGGW